MSTQIPTVEEIKTLLGEYEAALRAHKATKMRLAKAESAIGRVLDDQIADYKSYLPIEDSQVWGARQALTLAAYYRLISPEASSPTRSESSAPNPASSQSSSL